MKVFEKYKWLVGQIQKRTMNVWGGGIKPLHEESKLKWTLKGVILLVEDLLGRMNLNRCLKGLLV